MNISAVGILVSSLLAITSASDLCTDSYKEAVGRIVFGEARGESQLGQLAVAYTIVNRVTHRGYPNSLLGVAHQTYDHGHHHQYNTLDVASHDTAWAHAKETDSAEYEHAHKAATDALCRLQTDPTQCATDYCAYDPCSATSSNKYWTVKHKIRIGHHYFVCRESA